MTLHKGYRTKCRRKHRKPPRQRGLGSVEKYLIDYDVGDKVDVITDPSQHKRGMPFKRYHGRTGVITGIRGRCFEVEVSIRNAKKLLILGREHLRLNHDYKKQ